MHGAKSVARAHRVAAFFPEHNSDSRIDRVILLFASAAENHAGSADLLASDARNESAASRANFFRFARARQARRILHRTRIAALLRNYLTEFITSAACSNHFFGNLLPGCQACGRAGEKEHPSGELDAKRAQIGRPAIVQDFQAFCDFERVANGVAERLVHVGYERNDAFAHVLSGVHKQLGERNGVFFILHERAVAGFHVEHERIKPLGEFFRHDGSADQAGTLHRAGYITQSVEALIGRSNFRSRGAEGAIARRERVAKFAFREIDVEPGYGFELVERAAGVAEAAPANHWYVNWRARARSGNNRRNSQRSLVA